MRASHSAHWGAFSADWNDGRLDVEPHPGDPDPNPIFTNIVTAVRHRARIAEPMVRKGWLLRGPGPDEARGHDEFVVMPWDEVLDRLAAELRRVADRHGAKAVYGGSYGWASAGRFHHAQSQIHRFLNVALGGYTRSVNNYSAGAAQVVFPHVLCGFEDGTRRNVTWEQVATHTEVLLAFGGMALKNSRVGQGGVSRHIERGAMRQAAERGCRFLCISPLASDLPEEARAEWWPVKPGTDTALMLGLCHELVTAGLHDQAFVDRYCDGWKPFWRYLVGKSDGIAKTPAWAAAICGIAAHDIVALARSLQGRRTLVVVSHSLQRAEHGEQPVWMGAVLAALLGQHGLPGGGYNYALGTIAHYGRRSVAVPIAALPQGTNGVSDFIPVARIADMLLKPGEAYPFNGKAFHYPDIRLAYWAGGNPFHHHQDLARLARAFVRLDTFIVQESAWTATARHADIVLPVTLSVEREDIGACATDPLMIAMHRVLPPYANARDDYDIFCDLAKRLGRLEAFSEGRDARAWLRWIYAATETAMREKGLDVPDFDEFWKVGELALPMKADDGGVIRAFRDDPVGCPLPTPSGKIQLSSPAIEAFGYADCPGHPAWLEKEEVPTANYPLWLVSNQPDARLHSQLDFGSYSQASKRRGREVATMHPDAAAARGIAEGDVVRLFNERGSCLAAVALSARMRPDVLRLPTGAWLDLVTDERGLPMCVHGNPNLLTRDYGTSALAQACTGQLSRVQVERFAGELPPVRAYDPPLSAS